MLFMKKRQALNIPEFEKILNLGTDPRINDAFQNIINKLARINANGKCKMIAIASANYGEGKSYVAVNAAITFSDTFIDNKILFVNIDSSNSIESIVVSKLFTSTNDTTGLSEYLCAGFDSFDFNSSVNPNLFVLDYGKATTAPISLLNSNRMNEFLALIADKFDFVVFNLPPLNESTYSTAFADKIDGFVLVAREGVTSIDEISDAEDAILAANGKILGVILTGHIEK